MQPELSGGWDQGRAWAAAGKVVKTVNLYRAFITCDMQCEGAYEPDLTGFWPRPREDLLFSCPCFAEEDAKAQRSDVACPSHTVDAQEAAEQVLNSALRDPRAFAFDVTLRGAGDAEESIRRALL